jgi:hypothetical protein
MQAWDVGGNFRDLIRASGALADAELAACFDPAPALGHIDEIFVRAGLEPGSPGLSSPGDGGSAVPLLDRVEGGRRHG